MERTAHDEFDNDYHEAGALPEQHINPITNAGRIGWGTLVANANLTGTTGTILKPLLKAITSTEHNSHKEQMRLKIKAKQRYI